MAKMPKPIKTKSGRTILPAPLMEGETVADRRREVKRWAEAFAAARKKPTLAQRCRIHAEKMQGEGWYVTANVLWAAANALELDMETHSRFSENNPRGIGKG